MQLTGFYDRNVQRRSLAQCVNIDSLVYPKPWSALTYTQSII